MNLEEHLNRRLREEAERLPAPRVSLGQVMGQGESRDRRRWLSLAAATAVVFSLVGAGVALVGTGSSPTLPAVTEAATTSAPPTGAPATTAPVESVLESSTPPSTLLAFSAGEATKNVVNLVAALQAGAYEQAAVAATRGQITITGQEAGETAAEAMERLCEGGACAGEYQVVEASDAVKTEAGDQAVAMVVVASTETGETGAVRVTEMNGELVVPDLPPLVPTAAPAPTLVERLFGEAPPDRVVVERLEAYEIWEDGSVEWVTNPFAGLGYQVEGEVVVTDEVTTNLRDPETRYPRGVPQAAGMSCSVQLLTRDGEVLGFEECGRRYRTYEVTSGRSRPTPVRYRRSPGEETYGFLERNGVVVEMFGQPEGNVEKMTNADGIDLLAGDVAGLAVLSVDGSRVAYVDHADPASHGWSPVLVVRDTIDGKEVGRWVLDGPILDIQFSGRWVVAGVAVPDGDDPATGEEPEQTALVALDLETSTLTIVDTPVRVFLPS